jgi:hypothetical protein
MKIAYLIGLLTIIISCQEPTNPKFEENDVIENVKLETNPITKEPITKLELLVVDSSVVFSHFDDVQVFQYFDKDSLNGKVSHSEKLDTYGNIIAEYFKDYNTNKREGQPDNLKYNEYDVNNRLITSTTYYETFQRGGMQKQFYYYNDTLLVREESFDLTKKLKAGVDRGIAFPEDYEKKGTWEIGRIVIYDYDNFGRKVLSYSPVFQSSHNRFEYLYDNRGDLVEEKSMDQSELLYTIFYEYNDDEIISDLHWDRKEWGSIQRIKTIDNSGKLKQELTILEDMKYRDVYEYENNGKLAKLMTYDRNGKIGLTHIYKYNVQ